MTTLSPRLEIAAKLLAKNIDLGIIAAKNGQADCGDPKFIVRCSLQWADELIAQESAGQPTDQPEMARTIQRLQGVLDQIRSKARPYCITGTETGRRFILGEIVEMVDRSLNAEDAS